MKLSTPTVHMNGTSKRELLQLRQSIINELHAAEQRLRDAAPHMRDYYVGLDGSFSAASVAFERRFRIIHDLITELEVESLEIYNQ